MAAWRITRSLTRLRFSPGIRWRSSKQQAAADEGSIFDFWKEAIVLVAIPAVFVFWELSNIGPKKLDDDDNAEGGVQKMGLRNKIGKFWQQYFVEDQEELQNKVDNYLQGRQQEHSEYLLLKSQISTKRYQVPTYDFVKQMKNSPVNRIE